MDKSSLKLNFRHCVVLGGAQRGAEYYDKHEPGVSHGIIFKHSKYDKTDKLLHTHSFFSFFIRSICIEELWRRQVHISSELAFFSFEGKCIFHHACKAELTYFPLKASAVDYKQPSLILYFCIFLFAQQKGLIKCIPLKADNNAEANWIIRIYNGISATSLPSTTTTATTSTTTSSDPANYPSDTSSSESVSSESTASGVKPHVHCFRFHASARVTFPLSFQPQLSAGCERKYFNIGAKGKIFIFLQIFFKNCAENLKIIFPDYLRHFIKSLSLFIRSK